MKETKLINCLTTEERLNVTRLLGHDAHGHLNMVSQHLGNIELAQPHLNHIKEVNHTVAVLTHIDNIYINDNPCQRDSFVGSPGSSIVYFTDKLKRLHPKLKIAIHDRRDFLSFKSMIHVVASNLIKNALVAQKNLKNALVLLDIQYKENFPKNPSYVPEGSRNYNKFMVFSFQNPGEFPKHLKIIDRLTKCPELGRPGFGLYFTGLAAKVMQAPIKIKSENNQSTVSFYHPIYVE